MALVRWMAVLTCLATGVVLAPSARPSYWCYLYSTEPPEGPLPDGTVGTFYEQCFAALSYNTANPYWELIGTLPPGLKFIERQNYPSACYSNWNLVAFVEGRPTVSGTWSFTLTYNSISCGLLASLDYTITINDPCTLSCAGTPPNGTVGVAYDTTFTASGGTPPYRFAVETGRVPPGLHLSSWGSLSGTPSSSGRYSVKIRVHDSGGCSVAKTHGIDIRGRSNFVAGMGAGRPNPNHVRVFVDSGVSAVDLVPYSAGHWGAEVAAGDVTASLVDSLVTGPGPGPGLGPHVRGFDATGMPIAGLGFFAYGTLKYGAHPALGDLDGDAHAEIVTGAGAGSVFGAHVRGFDADTGTVSVISDINYFAYATPAFGVNLATGRLTGADVDILTGPGPGSQFASTVRGWRYAGQPVRPIPGGSFNAFGAARYGARVGTSDVDADDREDVLCGHGAGAAEAAQIRGFYLDGGTVLGHPGLDVTPYPTLYGALPGGGDVDRDGRGDVLTAAGPDPAAPAILDAFAYDGAALSTLGWWPAFSGVGFGAQVGTGHLDH